jgi:GNAT superfamily N-acetyltransferase
VGSFQDLEVELGELPGRYSKEFGGCLLVLYPGQSPYTQGLEVVHRQEMLVKKGVIGKDSGALACVAVKALTNHERTCEMKRMFVRPEYRKLGIGQMLLEQAVREAEKVGSYASMKLDSLERLPIAVTMYTNFGFQPCDPYVTNPEPDAVYLELPLKQRAVSGDVSPEFQDIANAFVQARRVPCKALESLPSVASIEEAYKIQSLISQQAGEIVGWKVGATNPAATKRMGLTEAFRGPLYAQYVRRYAFFSTPSNAPANIHTAHTLMSLFEHSARLVHLLHA